MALKAMFVLASVMAIAHGLAAPEDQPQQLEVAEIKEIPITYPVDASYAVAEERGDLLSGGTEPQGWGWQPAKPVSTGWGWQPQPQVQSAGWGWPKFKYLKFTIPIPILPRIKFGIKGGLKLNAAIQHPKGWGWSK